MTRLRLLIRNAIVAIFRFLGSEVIDRRTGKRAGRAFVFGWKGRVIVIGLETEPPLRPIFLPQERLTYWKQEIGFTSPPPPDFPSEPSRGGDGGGPGKGRAEPPPAIDVALQDQK